jgi:hypothetical protein
MDIQKDPRDKQVIDQDQDGASESPQPCLGCGVEDLEIDDEYCYYCLEDLKDEQEEKEFEQDKAQGRR